MAARAPVVLGRVGEPTAPLAGAQVTLSQPGRPAQVVRTGPDGVYRIRAFEGPGSVALTLPAGWTLQGPATQTFDQAQAGDFVRLDFVAHARRVLRGRLLYQGEPLSGVDVRGAHTDDRGGFALEGLPGGRSELRIEPLGLKAPVEMPAGPGETSRDVAVLPPALESLRLALVAQEPARRPLASWVVMKPMSESEVTAIERLCAVANLDPAFRLVMVAPPRDPRGPRAALMLLRYLTGPGRVAPERILFAVAEVAQSGQLALILMR